jgi:hypothetical protein
MVPHAYAHYARSRTHGRTRAREVAGISDTCLRITYTLLKNFYSRMCAYVRVREAVNR